MGRKMKNEIGAEERERQSENYTSNDRKNFHGRSDIVSVAECEDNKLLRTARSAGIF
jgi:hypothetical protein